MLIPGAGEGQRLGAGPKSLLTLDGEPLWQRAVRQSLSTCAEVVLAVNPVHLEAVSEALAALQTRRHGDRDWTGARAISGGLTRQHSVELALRDSRAPMLMVHDAARPFCSEELMRQVAAAAQAHGAAACTTLIEAPVADVQRGVIMQPATATLATDNSGRPARYLVHTPLAFRREILVNAYDQAHAQGWQAASTVELVQRAGHTVAAVDGDRRHFKITFPGDVEVAQALGRIWD